jgi:predicted RNA binding protein YcfA (HicA-like mRNA interferase family)
MATTVKEIIRRLEDDGWTLVATKGSHRQFKHKIRKGRVTVPGKLSADLQPGTLKSILRQAGLKD